VWKSIPFVTEAHQQITSEKLKELFDSREKTALIGSKRYLSKPFAIHELAIKIRELLDTSE
jgi:hypothetical protein